MATDVSLLPEIRAALYRKSRGKARKLFWLILLSNLFTYILVFTLGLFITSFAGPLAAAFTVAIPFLIMMSRVGKIREKRFQALLTARGCRQEFAEEVLRKKKRFSVFLRSFGYERANRVLDDDGMGGETDSIGVRVFSGAVEKLLVEIQRKDIALLALSDPVSPEPLPGVYRFYDEPLDWQGFIQNLLPNARVIFLYLSSFSPGIAIELEILKTQQGARKTIIIVSREFAAFQSRQGQELLLKLSAFAYVVFEQWEPYRWTINRRERIWTRRQERSFHQRLRQCLIELEQSQDEQIIEGTKKKYRLETPPRFIKELRFVKGPVIWGSITYLIFVAWRMIDMYGIPEDIFWKETNEYIEHWPYYVGCFLLFKYISLRLFND